MPQIQLIDRVVDFPVVLQRRVPTVQTVQLTAEFFRCRSWTGRSHARRCATTDAHGSGVRKLLKSSRCSAFERGGRFHCCAGLAGEVHRQLLTYGGCGGGDGVFVVFLRIFALLRVVLELSASSWSPMAKSSLPSRAPLHNS